MATARIARRNCFPWRSPRSGLATIEVALVLPLVAIIVLTMFSAASIIFTNLSVSGFSRFEAWSGRHRPWVSSPDYSTKEIGLRVNAELDRILGDEGRLSPTAVVFAEVEAEVPFCWPETVLADLKIARSEHFTTGGTWDYREIRFEGKGSHDRLEPTDKFQFFARSRIDFSPLRGLETFASAARSTALNTARKEHDRTYRQQQEEVKRRRREVWEALEEKELEEQALLAELESLDANDPSNAERIGELEARLDEVRGQLQDLHEAREQLDAASAALPARP